jgi:CDP-diacylglycerol---serine O-phosphatidyltransferase
MTENITRDSSRFYRLRALIPQVLTGSRIVFGAAAIITAGNGRLEIAAMLVTLGAVTDILDGFLARRLGVASAFGALFDTFTDYLCFVVAPWAMCRALIGAEGSVFYETLTGLPLLTGALRYARNSLIIATQTGVVRELPGLATVFFAFLPVVTVFLDARAFVNESILAGILTFLTVIFSLLMVTSVRYPKLTNFSGASALILILLVAMPFLGTRVLAGLMFIVGLCYVALGPLLIRDRSAKSDEPV